MSKIIIIDRLNSIHSIFREEYVDNEYSKTCPIFIKKYFDYKEIESVQKKFIPKLSYNTRGFYFVPMRTDYSKILYLFQRENGPINNGNNSTKNIKSTKNGNSNKNSNKVQNNLSENVFTFRIMKTMKADVYELYLMEEDNLVKKGIALVQTTELSHKLLSFFKNKNQMSEVKVECKLNEEFNKWVPLRLSKKEISSVYDL